MKFIQDVPLTQVFFMTISVSFMGMAIAAIITESLQKTRLLTRFSNLKFIKNDKVNDLIGVNITKWFVTKTFWKQTNQKLQLQSSTTLDGLNQIRFEMTKAEIGHLIAFIFQSIIVIVAVMLDADQALVIALIIANILLNFYPTLLQQRNKARIDRLMARFTPTTEK